jgi:uncharacterized protein YifE (UPF0438 family)
MLQEVRKYSKRFQKFLENKATKGSFQKLLKGSKKFCNVLECSRKLKTISTKVSRKFRKVAKDLRKFMMMSSMNKTYYEIWYCYTQRN